jgi:hypothetical protein
MLFCLPRSLIWSCVAGTRQSCPNCGVRLDHGVPILTHADDDLVSIASHGIVNLGCYNQYSLIQRCRSMQKWSACSHDAPYPCMCRRIVRRWSVVAASSRGTDASAATSTTATTATVRTTYNHFCIYIYNYEYV